MRKRNRKICQSLIASALCLNVFIGAHSVYAKADSPSPKGTVVVRDDAMQADNIPIPLLGGLLIVATTVPLFLLHRSVQKVKKEMQESRAYFNKI